MKEFIDIQVFIKELIGDSAKVYSFPFTDKKEWKTHTLKRYGYCDEETEKVLTHLLKETANRYVSVAKYNNSTNEGIAIDRREGIR